MIEIPGWIATVISGLTAVVVGFFLNGVREKEKARETRIANLERAVGNKELSTKEDSNQLDRRLAALETALGDIKVMLGRMDERWKLTHGE